MLFAPQRDAHDANGIERYTSLNDSVLNLLTAFKTIPTERMRAERVAKISPTIS